MSSGWQVGSASRACSQCPHTGPHPWSLMLCSCYLIVVNNVIWICFLSEVFCAVLPPSLWDGFWTSLSWPPLPAPPEAHGCSLPLSEASQMEGVLGRGAHPTPCNHPGQVAPWCVWKVTGLEQGSHYPNPGEECSLGGRLQSPEVCWFAVDWGHDQCLRDWFLCPWPGHSSAGPEFSRWGTSTACGAGAPGHTWVQVALKGPPVLLNVCTHLSSILCSLERDTK